MSIPRTGEVDPNAPRSQATASPRWSGPIAGLVAAGVAVGVGVLIAAIADVDSPLDAVGSEFIDHTPKWLKIWAIDRFGSNDKTALRTGIWVTIAVLAAVLGYVARRRRWLGPAGIAAFGVFGAVITANRPTGSFGAAIAPLVGAATGAGLIWYLLAIVSAHDVPTSSPGMRRPAGDFDRRRFLVTSGAGAGVAAIAFATSRRLESQRVQDLQASIPDSLPAPVSSTPVPVAASGPEGATLSPITPFITPNDNFYLIDTALSVPRINTETWKLQIGGKVTKPLTLTYADLLARPQVERTITICCVSNEVGGDLIGNAVWQGVLLADVLKEAGVAADAQQVFATSVDGWTCGFPVEAAMDGRDAMIAVGMNGQPLPLQHGFPARVIVPGLYGYVSATKWVSSLELTTWDAAEGYWVPRGWSRDAPIKTGSRIDVPRSEDQLVAGKVAVAGIAWAQQRGIAKVEVRVDDAPWTEARLAIDVSADTWRQWVYEWEATSGTHTIQVRATDTTGETQTETVARPDPDGATGYHTRRVTVG